MRNNDFNQNKTYTQKEKYYCIYICWVWICKKVVKKRKKKKVKIRANYFII